MSEEKRTAPELPGAVQWGACWLLILTSLFVLCAFASLLHLHVLSVSLPLCVIVSLMLFQKLAHYEGRPLRGRRLVLIGVAFFVAVVAFGYVAAFIWEQSNWGRGFYTEAIVALAGGWNPIYDDAGTVSELALRSGKAVWYVDACLYTFLGHYEMAKAHTLLFAVPTFLLTRYCFGRLLHGRRRMAALAALLAVFSPVAISQVFSFYSDAVLAYCIQCFLLLAFLILNEGYLRSDLLMVLAFLWVFILHATSGGLRAAVVLAVGFAVTLCVLYQKQAVRWLAIRAAVVTFSGFVIIGFNPFIQNLVDTGSLLSTTDLTASSMPVILEGKTWLGKMIYSMVASPAIDSLGLNLLVQQLTALVNTAYAAPDVALRGFGFIGGFLILIALVLLVFSVFLPRYKGMDSNAIYVSDEEGEEGAQVQTDYIGRRLMLLWFTVPVIFIVLFTSTIWWARSIAVAWWLLPVALVALASRRDDGRSHIARLLLTVAFLNCALMAFSAWSTAKMESGILEGYWARMADTTDLPSDEDAQLHNQFVTQFKYWNQLKHNGEQEREDHAIWTKIERLVK